jgi:hypothetical protein
MMRCKEAGIALCNVMNHIMRWEALAKPRQLRRAVGK